MHAAVLLLTITLTTVEGRVTVERTPLPGATVTLIQQSVSRTVVSDAWGRYRFTGVPSGAYEVTAELEGFEPVRERVSVGATPLVIPDLDLRLGSADTITISCELGAVCSDYAPTSRSDLPSCADYELDSALIDAAKNGDRSALRMIEQRHASAETYRQRLRLAGALLRRSSGDAVTWQELSDLADVVMRFPKAGLDPNDEEYLQWCAARSLDPVEHWSMAVGALQVASEDARSRPMLMRIVDEENSPLLSIAIGGLARQRDFAALPAIDRALARAGDEAGQVALALALFADERADAIAKKYLSEPEAITYDEWR